MTCVVASILPAPRLARSIATPSIIISSTYQNRYATSASRRAIAPYYEVTDMRFPDEEIAKISIPHIVEGQKILLYQRACSYM